MTQRSLIISAALACSLWNQVGLRGNEPAADAGLARAWTGDSVSLWGAPSPDGQWLSFVDAATGDLALRRLADGTRRVVARAPGAGSGQFAYFSVFSRAGKRVAYAWFNAEGRYELRVSEVPGESSAAGPGRAVFSNPEIRFVQPSAWSSDGTQLLALFFRQDNTSQIALVDIESGEARALRSLQWIYPKRMDLSPDGRYVIYDNLSGRTSAERDIFVLRTDGSEERRLVSGAANDESPVWSLDGRTVWFVSDRGEAPGIWSVGVRDGTATGPPRRLTGPFPRALLMGATREREVFVGQRLGAAELHVQRWDKESDRPDAESRPVFAAKSNSGRSLPAFAPDGESLAYLAGVGTENHGQGHRSVVIHSLETGRSAALPVRLTFVRTMEFAPDGGSLLFSGRDRRGRSGLFAFDRQTERTRPVALAGSPHGAFAPDGTSVLLGIRPESGDRVAIVERPLRADSPERRVATLPASANLAALSVSRDGQRLALAWTLGEADFSATLAVVDRGGGVPEPIVTLPGGGLTGCAWTPGGRHIVLGTRGRQGTRLWAVSAAGTSMTEIPSPRDRLPGISFSPDGEWLAYAAGRTEQAVWVLRDDAPQLP